MVQFTEFDEKRNFEDGVPVLLDGLRIECEKVTAELAAKYNWSNTDFRVVTFHRLRNVIQSVLAARIFQYSIFPNSNFWQAFFIRVPSTDEMEDHFRELDTMIRFVAFQGIFSALESDVRELVRRIDPEACSRGRANFDGVTRWILPRAVTATQYSDFLEIIRLTRNTIHNNGVHRPQNGQSSEITWNGRTCRFDDDKPIEFADWPFVAFIAKETLGFLRCLVQEKIVVELPSD